MQRERLADCRHGAQAVAAGNLIEKHGAASLKHRQIDCFSELSREILQQRPHGALDVHPRRRGKSHERRSESHTCFGGCRNEHLLGRQRVDDALYGGAGEAGSLRDLTETESAGGLFERAQDRGGPRDRLNALFGGGIDCICPLIGPTLLRGRNLRSELPYRQSIQLHHKLAKRDVRRKSWHQPHVGRA